MSSLEQFGEAFFPPKQSKVSTAYGTVTAVNADGSYQVKLNALGTTRCARLCNAAVDDAVLVIIQENGKCAAVGKVGGESSSGGNTYSLGADSGNALKAKLTENGTDNAGSFTVPDGTTSAKGAVQLDNTPSSNTTKAATPKAVSDALASAKAYTDAQIIAAGAVTGVKGNAQEDYQHGDVNLTPADLGAATATHTHTASSIGTGDSSNVQAKLDALNTAVAGKAPTAHASSGTSYGTGNSINYGHVKLSDAHDSSSASSAGVAATPKAVKDAYDLAAQKAAINHKSTQNTYGVGDSSYYGHVKLSSTPDASKGTASGTAATPMCVADAVARVLKIDYTIGTDGTLSWDADELAAWLDSEPVGSCILAVSNPPADPDLPNCYAGDLLVNQLDGYSEPYILVLHTSLQQALGTITGVQANGTTVALSGMANIPAATTSAYGVTELSSSTSSNSESLAATPKAVKAAYDKATGAENIASDAAQAIAEQGIPTGGTTGQVLAKASGTNYDVEWVNHSAPDVLYYDAAGTSGDVTLSSSAANYTHMRIYFMSAGSGAPKASVDVYDPNQKYAALTLLSTFFNPQLANVPYMLGKRAYIDGTSISVDAPKTIMLGSSISSSSNDNIKIYRVEAW